MGKYIINGGRRLDGRIELQTSKNAVLPILAASVLTSEQVVLEAFPKIDDVKNMVCILQSLGCRVTESGGSAVIDNSNTDKFYIPNSLAKELRSSIFLLGPVLGRFQYAKVSYPGGCDIGLRPIDLHLKGLKCLGVEINEHNGIIECDGRNMRGGVVQLDFPSVGATENIMLAGATAKGRTIIRNAAKEPEIVDLQNFVNSMGGRVVGAGCSTIEIEGVERLHGTTYRPIPDRIAAGTYLLAGVMCGGKLEISGCIPEHIYSLIFKLRESACKIDCIHDKIYLEQNGRPQAVHMVETSPYPGFPTDLQAQFMACSTLATGTGVIVENIFETRFRHAAELIKMGANITVRDRMAIVRGVPALRGAEVYAHDLRGGAALVLAGLAAEGQTVVNDIKHIERGYEDMEGVLTSLGADITRI